MGSADLRSGEKIRRREDLADIEVAGSGRVGEIDVRMGFSQFVNEIF